MEPQLVQLMALLREIFGNRIISRFSDFNWPPRSPDLTAPDFFFGVTLKVRYMPTSQELSKLKANNREEVRTLGSEMPRKCSGKSTSGRNKQWAPFEKYYLQNIM